MDTVDSLRAAGCLHRCGKSALSSYGPADRHGVQPLAPTGLADSYPRLVAVLDKAY